MGVGGRVLHEDELEQRERCGGSLRETMVATFHFFASAAFGAEEAGRLCDVIIQRMRMGGKSKLDPRILPPVGVLSGLTGHGRLGDVFGDGFDFSDWHDIDAHGDGSCRLSVRRPPKKSSGMIPVREVVLQSSRNTEDGSRKQYVFKGRKDARHTGAFIFIVSLLDHIGGASSRCVMLQCCLFCLTS